MKTQLKIGAKAPGFCLKDAEEREHCLKEYNGQWVVLYFYPKDTTSGCTQEAVDFTQNIKQFEKLGASIIGVSPDSPQSHAKFIDKHDLRILLLSDPEHQVLKHYGVWQKKKLYGREYHGVIRTTFVINPKGRIAHVWQKVKVKGHVQDVHAAVAQSCRRK